MNLLSTETLQQHRYKTEIGGDNLLTIRIAYNADGDAEYLGLAAPGSNPAQAVWMLRKILYDLNRNPQAITFASGKANFDNIWDNRSDYSFS